MRIFAFFFIIMLIISVVVYSIMIFRCACVMFDPSSYQALDLAECIPIVISTFVVSLAAIVLWRSYRGK